MGLIKAVMSSTSSSLGDQFKEFVVCPEIDKNVLIQRGVVKHGDGNKNASEGIITNGSGIVVPDGMCMMLIDNGVIVEFVAEAGVYTYDTVSEPTIFEDGFFKGIKETIKNIGRRITYGGEVAHDQRVYYINIKVITGNKFGSPQPKKITDEKYGMLEVTFFGEYSFQVVEPVTFIVNVIGANASDTITYDMVVGSQLKMKFIEKFTQAVSEVMRKDKVSFGDLGMYGSKIAMEMNNALDDSWRKEYGLVIRDVAIGDINITEESMRRVNKLDDAIIYSDKNLQSGLMASAVSDALIKASENDKGAVNGFMGMTMAGNVSGSTLGVGNNQDSQAEKFCKQCGSQVNGNFCSNCGTKID